MIWLLYLFGRLKFWNGDFSLVKHFVYQPKNNNDQTLAKRHKPIRNKHIASPTLNESFLDANERNRKKKNVEKKKSASFDCGYGPYSTVAIKKRLKYFMGKHCVEPRTRVLHCFSVIFRPNFLLAYFVTFGKQLNDKHTDQILYVILTEFILLFFLFASSSTLRLLWVFGGSHENATTLPFGQQLLVMQMDIKRYTHIKKNETKDTIEREKQAQQKKTLKEKQIFGKK